MEISAALWGQSALDYPLSAEPDHHHHHFHDGDDDDDDVEGYYDNDDDDDDSVCSVQCIGKVHKLRRQILRQQCVINSYKST